LVPKESRYALRYGRPTLFAVTIQLQSKSKGYIYLK
jgi:hypothetical protein